MSDSLLALHAYADWALMALRVALACVFFAHGFMKRTMWRMKPNKQMNGEMIATMKLLSICEPLGAFALMTGTLTQFAALACMIVMLGAINLKAVRMGKKFTEPSGWELDFVLFFSLLVVAVLGAGQFSIDRMFLGL